MIKEKISWNIIHHNAIYDWGNDYSFMEIHGYAVGRVYTIKEEADVAYIEGLHVSEVVRRKGIGTEMINKLIDKCRETGSKKCNLWCDKNKWMYKWYQRLGFKYDGDKKDQDGFVWMVKEL
nr:MAG TPA: acetyltransferase domain containing protein [Bacteriophage sp.]